MATNNDDENLSGNSNMLVTCPPNPKFSNTWDSQLLVLAGNKNNLQQAEEAFHQLHHNFAQRLVGICLANNYKTYKEDAVDLVSVVMKKIWDKAAMFTPKQAISREHDQQLVFAWMLKILRNHLNDVWNDEKDERDNRHGTENDPQTEIDNTPQGEESSIPSGIAQLVKDHVNTLNPNDHDILETSFRYSHCYKDKKTGESKVKVKLPDDIRKDLYKKCGIDENYLRVKRNRLIANLKEHLNNHPKLKLKA